MNIEQKYFKRAKFVAGLIKNIPFIRLIAVNGSLAAKKAKPDSDIDFFIMTQNGRLWLARLLVFIIIDLFFLRARQNHHAGKICLNHFLCENALMARRDKFNAYQYAHLLILYNKRETYQNFQSVNAWINKYYQFSVDPNIPLSKNGNFKNFLEKILSAQAGNFLEKKCREFQTKRIKCHPYYQQKDAALCADTQEFYYYTEVTKKYQLWQK